MDDFISYDEALSQLSISKDELNDIVAKGELRAFRDGDDVRFKREDIANLKKGRETEPTIVLSDTEADKLSFGDEEPIDLDSISTDETVLNIEGLLEDETEGTTPIPGADEISLDDEIDIGSIGDDTVLDTDGIELDDDFELSDDDTLLDSEEDTLLAGSRSRSVQMVKKESHAWATVLLAGTVFVMLWPLAILLNLMSGEGIFPDWVASNLTLLNGAVEGLLNVF